MNPDDSDGSTRVTRRSLRRRESNDSMSDAEARPITPTLKMLGKKLDTITETRSLISVNPTVSAVRRTQSEIKSPISRRTRNKVSDFTPVNAFSSPLRRSTRRASQEREIVSSPLPTRARRSLLDSDSEDQQVSTPGKSARKKRQSTISQIPEMPEEDEEEKSTQEEDTSPLEEEMSPQKDDKSTLKQDELNELELRTRSISKSPSVHSPPKAKNSPAATLKSEYEDFGGLDSPKPEVPHKIFKNRVNSSDTKSNGSELNYPDDDLSDASSDAPPIEKFSRKQRRSEQPSKQTFDDIIERLGKSCEGPDRKTEDVKEEQQNNVETPILARRSIHSSSEDAQDEAADKLMADFVPDVTLYPETPDTPQSGGISAKTPMRTPKSHLKSASLADTKLMTPKVGTPQEDTPGSAKATTKTPKVATPPSDRDVKVKTPKVATPQSAKATPKAETPQSALNGSAKSLQKTPKTTTPQSAKKTPKIETPQSAKKTPKTSLDVVEDMDISNAGETSDMDITMIATNQIGQKSSADAGTSNGSSKKLSRSWSQSVNINTPTTASPQRRSLAAYLEQVRTTSSGGQTSSSGTEEAPVVSRARHSWSQSVTKRVTHDETAKNCETDNIQEQSVQAMQRRKSISSDESEDEGEKNEFVDDEAEVGEEESITESELNYLKENEIPDDGESLGSQDSDEMEIEESEQEEESDNSFIDRDHVSDEYSMDSHEENVEQSPVKPRRRSRLIIPSSSEDEEEVVEEKSPKKVEKSPAKKDDSPAKANKSPATYEQEIAIKKNLKRKRESLNQSVVIQGKRMKLRVSISSDDEEEADVDEANDGEAKHMEDLSGVAKLFDGDDSSTEDEDSSSSEDEEPEHVPAKPIKPSKSSAGSVDIESVLSKCNEIMGAYYQEKKAKLALKREQKAKKKALKLLEEKKAAGDNLDSSNGENKENKIKKKKKNKHKKQKLVDDLAEKKEDMAKSVSRAQAKLERKRQRKMEKKLAKAQEAEKSLNAQETAVADTIPSEKKSKKSHNDSGNKVTETVQNDKLDTSGKQLKKKKESITIEVDVAALQASRKKRVEETIAQEVETPVSKSKKVAAGEIVAQESSVDNPKRSKKSKREIAASAVDTEELVVDQSLKKSKKSKDKKALEAVNDVVFEEEAPRKKKKKHADADTEIVPEVEVPVKHKKKKILDIEAAAEIVQEVEAPVKKKKKAAAEEIIIQDSQVEKAKKSKKSKQDSDPMVVDEPPTKKSKKRKFAEVEEADIEKPKSKKRLNALEKLENPSAYQDEYIANNNRQPEEFSVPLQSQKLKKIIPPTQIAQKLKKKRTKKKRVISEPPMTLPQPVWTTSGVFLEQPASPFKFMSTEYIPIKTGAGSTNFGVVVFKADKQKKKVLQQQQPQDFKTQHMNRNKHIRDGSMKNLRGLIPK